MTGFGEARHQDETMAMSVEVRALNNRYLKVSLRATDPYHLLESDIEKLIRQVVRRGTVQVHLRFEKKPSADDYQINPVALKSYLQQVKAVADECQLGNQTGVLLGQVLALPGVVSDQSARSTEIEEDWQQLRQVLNQALAKLQKMRTDEGQAMALELLQYRDQLRNHLELIQLRIPQVAESYRQRLYDRVRSILQNLDIDLDRNDLIKEVSIYSERSDIAEEVIRLNSHLDQFQEIMNETESPGRKLEFLTQEMFREANTIGSKASDVDISKQVVEIKGILEKIRELVQNVE